MCLRLKRSLIRKGLRHQQSYHTSTLQVVSLKRSLIRKGLRHLNNTAINTDITSETLPDS